MSNRRKATAASSRRRPGAIPVLVLEQYGASLLTKPGSEQLVSLRLGGVDFDSPTGGSELVTDFVMFPAEARALIAALQQALPD